VDGVVEGVVEGVVDGVVDGVVEVVVGMVVGVPAKKKEIRSDEQIQDPKRWRSRERGKMGRGARK
jgi:hypothetical protein